MAARRWRVEPDSETVIGDELVRVVSRQAMVEAIMDGEAFLARSGGVLTVIVGRRRTDLEGEAVTTGAVVEWKDGARAHLRADPEPETQVLPQPGEAPEEAQDEPEVTAEQDAENAEAIKALASDNPDGFDHSELEDEDVDAIPASMR